MTALCSKNTFEEEEAKQRSVVEDGSLIRVAIVVALGSLTAAVNDSLDGGVFIWVVLAHFAFVWYEVSRFGSMDCISCVCYVNEITRCLLGLCTISCLHSELNET